MTSTKVPFTVSGSGGFWAHYRQTVRETVIPYQWRALNDEVSDAEPSHAIRNFKIVAGLETGEFHGMVFQDSDVGKWIEAVAYSLLETPSPELEALVDRTVDILAKAQAPDGYLNTYFTLKEPGRRWTNLRECHELYCAGHLLEGAIAYAQATGKRRFLEVMLRFVNLIGATFGRGPGQICGYDGHEEIEIALLRLYDFTREPRHLKLAQYFLEERGQDPNFFEQEWERQGHVSHWTGLKTATAETAYFQAQVPIRELPVAAGHAVRAVYLYAAMAHLAKTTGDESLVAACRRLWDNVVQRQMYVTGGIGSTHLGEAFTFDYDLPAETGYAETCASVGLVFFTQHLLELSPDAQFADVIELALYNGILAGMSLDGRRFLYVNPLEVVPEASAGNPDRLHVKARRQAWFACACCPPNLARLVMSVGNYICSQHLGTVYVHQFVSGTTALQGPGLDATLEVQTGYPFEGEVRLVLSGIVPAGFKLAPRRPGWCRRAALTLNGKPLPDAALENGYLSVGGPWVERNVIELSLLLEPEFLVARPEVRSAAGRVAVRRGPLVYCFEEADNGRLLSALSIDVAAGLTVSRELGLPLGAPEITARGRRDEPAKGGALYGPVGPAAGSATQAVTAVPYFLWGNRAAGEMAVWMRRK
jgi:DUF1680 family protein